MVCQLCRSLWSTCRSNALPHRWRKRYRAQGQGKSCLEGWIMFKKDHVSDSGAWRLFCGRPGGFYVLPLCDRATIVSPPCHVQSCFGRSSCRPSTTFMRRLTCQEMHKSIRLESVLSNTASLHSTAIMEFVAARMRACSSWNVLPLLECWRATPSVNTPRLSTTLLLRPSLAKSALCLSL